MVTLPVVDRTGAKVGEYSLDLDAFCPRISKQLLHEAVIMYQASARQGTFRTKTRGEVAGSSKKLYRQKGTGNARAGTRRSGTRRGGGHIHNKLPRDFGYRLPRKALKLATRMAIASRIRDQQVVVLDRLELSQPKTKEMAALLESLGLTGVTALVAMDRPDANVYMSSRNIEGVEVHPVSQLNALLVLRPKSVVLTKAALDSLSRSAAGE